MKDTDHKRGILKRERLDIWAVRLIVEGIHFSSRDTRILLAEEKVVGILVAVVVDRFFAYFDLFLCRMETCLLREKLSMPKSLKMPPSMYVYKGFDGNIKFRMIFKDMIKRLAFIKKWLDSLSN